MEIFTYMHTFTQTNTDTLDTDILQYILTYTGQFLIQFLSIKKQAIKDYGYKNRSQK